MGSSPHVAQLVPHRGGRKAKVMLGNKLSVLLEPAKKAIAARVW